MRSRTALLAVLAGLLVALPRPARADNLESFLKDALGAFPGKSKLPLDFYLSIPAKDYLEVQWTTEVSSGAFTTNSLTGNKWVKLNPNLSVDGQGGGGIRSITKMNASDSGTIFHEALHAYMNWARAEAKKGGTGDPRARRVADLQRSTMCRYREVVLAGSTQPAALDEEKQWQMVEESWTTWLAAFTNDWTFSVQQVALGNLTEKDVEDRAVEKLRDMAKNGTRSGPYYNDGSKQVYAANKRMSAREMKFLMENLLGLDKALIDRVFQDFKDAKSWDSDAGNLCVDRSVAYVLDASGSMADGGKIDQAKRAVEASVQSLAGAAAGTVEWALLVYGPSDCAGAPVVVPFTTDPTLIQDALAGVRPSGSTPLAKATTDAGNYIRSDARGRKHRNLVVLTDGGETCQGNPIEAAKGIREIRQSLPVAGGATP